MMTWLFSTVSLVLLFLVYCELHSLHLHRFITSRLQENNNSTLQLYHENETMFSFNKAAKQIVKFYFSKQ